MLNRLAAPRRAPPSPEEPEHIPDLSAGRRSRVSAAGGAAAKRGADGGDSLS
eukprot:COSAG01_NODE_382_length_17840_cov_68.658663_12_plen_52_part_00